MLTLVAAIGAAGLSLVDFVDGWMLSRTNDGQTCIIEQDTPENTKIQIATIKRHPGKILLYLANPSWTSAREGDRHPLEINIGRLSFTHTATGVPLGMLVSFEREMFLDRFYEGDTITINRSGTTLLHFSPYARRATRALRACAEGSADLLAD